MRIIQKDDPDDLAFASVDWRVSPQSVLIEVDKQLESFGLEVLMVAVDSDDYEWKIVKREPTP